MIVHQVTNSVWNKLNRTSWSRGSVTSGQFLLKSKEAKNVPGIILMEKSRYGVFGQQEHNVIEEGQQVK